MVGKELMVDASTIDKYLWEVGNSFCNKKKCEDCSLQKVCNVGNQNDI